MCRRRRLSRYTDRKRNSDQEGAEYGLRRGQKRWRRLVEQILLNENAHRRSSPVDVCSDSYRTIRGCCRFRYGYRSRGSDLAAARTFRHALTNRSCSSRHLGHHRTVRHTVLQPDRTAAPAARYGCSRRSEKSRQHEQSHEFGSNAHNWNCVNSTDAQPE